VITPAPIQVPRGDAPLSLTLEAEGYQPATVEVTPSESRAVAAALEPVAAAKTRSPRPKTKRTNTNKTRPSTGGKNTIEDPFRKKQ
jgi:hypothetical protein